MAFTLQDAAVAFVYTGTVTLRLPSGSVTATIGFANNQFPPGLFLNADFSTLGFSLDFGYENNTDCNHVSDGNIFFDTTTLGPNPGTWTACRTSEIDCRDKVMVSGANGVPGPPFQMVPSNRSNSAFSQNFISRLGFAVTCIDSSRNPVQNCVLTLDFAPEANSGGHNHDDLTRPSFLAVPSVSQTSTGLNVLYTAPEVAGDINVTVSGTDPNGNTITPVPFKIHVGLGPFTQLGVAPLVYELTGDTAIHPFNHWGLTTFDVALVKVASEYDLLLAPNELILGVNDMSLQFGGIFDICAAPQLGCKSITPWVAPHNTHRQGHSADIGSGQGVGFSVSIPVTHRVQLLSILSRNGLQPIRELSCNPQIAPQSSQCSHWHIEPY